MTSWKLWFETEAGKARSRGTCVIAPEGVVITTDARVVAFDLVRDRRRVVDHAAKVWGDASGARRVLDLLEERALALPAARAGSKVVSMDKRDFALQRVEVMSKRALVEAWASEGSRMPSAARALWSALGLRAPAWAGIPMEVVLRRRDDLDAPAARFRVVRIEEAADELPWPVSPKGYKDVGEAPVVKRASSSKGKASKKAPAQARRMFARAPPGPADHAFILRQGALDGVREALARVTPAFGRFSGRRTDPPAIAGEPTGIHLNVDWFAQLDAAVAPGRRREVDLLREAIFLWRVSDGEEPADMDDAQRARFAEAMAAAEEPSAIDIRGRRVLEFRSRFSGEEIAAFTDAFLAPHEATQVFVQRDAAGAPVTKIERELPEQGFGFRAENFDVVLDLGNRVLVEQLSFRNDGDGADGGWSESEVRARLRLERLEVRFDFMSWPVYADEEEYEDEGPFGILHRIGEAIADVTHFFVTANVGFGSFVIEDARIVVEITTGMDEGVPRLSARIHKPSTTLNSAVSIWGLNLAQSIVVNIADALFPITEGVVVEAIEQGVTEASNAMAALPWPAVWNARGAPEASRGQCGVRAHGLVAAATLGTGSLADVIAGFDPAGVESGGYALSAGYLSRWAQARAGAHADGRSLPTAALEEATGVTIPLPPASDGSASRSAGDTFLGGIGLGGRAAPSTSQPGKSLVFTRHAPVVVLPDDGPTDRAGTLEIHYDSVVANVRHEWRRVPTFKEGRTRIVPVDRIPRDRELPGGRDPFGGSPPGGGGGGGAGRPDPMRPDPGHEGVIAIEEPPEVSERWVLHVETGEPFVQAKLVARLPMRLGFQPMGEAFLPELAYAGVPGEDGVVRPTLEVSQLSYTVPFTRRTESALRAYLLGLCRADADAIAAPLALGDVDLRRAWLPPLYWGLMLGIDLDEAEAFSELLVVEQESGGNAPAYEVLGGDLYWSIALRQGFTDLLR